MGQLLHFMAIWSCRMSSPRLPGKQFLHCLQHNILSHRFQPYLQQQTFWQGHRPVGKKATYNREQRQALTPSHSQQFCNPVAQQYHTPAACRNHCPPGTAHRGGFGPAGKFQRRNVPSLLAWMSSAPLISRQGRLLHDNCCQEISLLLTQPQTTLTSSHPSQAKTSSLAQTSYEAL